MNKKSNFLAYIIILIMAVVIVAFVYNFHAQDISDNISDWGNFGSYLSGTLSILILCYTFIQQSRMIHKNQVDSIFFELLKEEREIYNKIDASLNLEYVEKGISKHFLFEDTLSEKRTIEDIKIILSVYYARHAYNINTLHYFRNLYHIIKYINDDIYLNNRQKKNYIDLIQSSMSNEQLYITLLNAVWYCNKHDTKNKYLLLLDKYLFFENINSYGIWFDNYMKKLFPNTIFKNHSEKLDISKLTDDDIFGTPENETCDETLAKIKHMV